MQYINKDDMLITAVFDAQPDFVLWIKPCLSDDAENRITDFKICYCNKAAALLSGITQQAALGRFLLKDCFPAIAPAAEVFEQSVKALNNSSENISAYHPLLKKHFSITTAKVNDGILVIARDITIQITAEKKMHEQSAFLNGILNASINAVFVCNAIIDADGKIIDFCIVKINRAFSVLTGKLPGEVEGAAYSSLFPEATSAGLFEMNCMVIETGEPLRKEVYYKDEYLVSCQINNVCY